MRKIALAVVALACAAPAHAGTKSDDFVVTNEDVGVPVFPYDITDRPYEIVGEVEVDVRKATVFSKSPSQQKIYKELWERAEKLGADAVVNASYGDARVTLISWGASRATGVAVRFVSDDRAASERD